MLHHAYLLLTMLGGAIDTYPRQPVDVEHYRFALTLTDSTDRIEGEATVRMRLLAAGLTRVELDLALEPQPSDLELCYDKPMGKVEFDAATGETRIIDLDPDLLIASENTSSAVPM